LPESNQHTQRGRYRFLIASVGIALVGGLALRLAQPHMESRRVVVALQFCLVVLGVFWVRSLGWRLEDAGWPRWVFWPWFLVVFTGLFAAHALKLLNSKEMLVLFLFSALVTVFLPSQRAPGAALESPEEAYRKTIERRRVQAQKVAPLGALEFAWYILLLAGNGYVLHLLWGDAIGFAHVRLFRYGIDATYVLLCVLWGLSVRGRLRALGLMHWTMGFCCIVLAACLLTLYYDLLTFMYTLLLFIAFQLPAVFLRQELIPGRVSSLDSDS
jgi:hypothetical protein